MSSYINEDKAAAQDASSVQMREAGCSDDMVRPTSQPLYVDFDSSTDAEHPYNWARTYKWSIVAILSSISLVTNIGTIMCSPAAPQILSAFDIRGRSKGLYTTLIVTIWELGEAFGPLFTAPLSELFGRQLIYNVANSLFIIFAVACALSSNIKMLVAFRFLNGLVVAAIALNPGVVADMFKTSERGRAMSVMNLPPLLGPTVAPIFSAYLTQAEGWRWAFWLSAILGGICQLLILLVYRETYKVQILRRKVKKLRKQGIDNATLPPSYNTGKGIALWRSDLFRPITILVQSPIVTALGLYVAVMYGYLFIILTSTTTVYEDVYGFSQGEAGLTFLGPGVGSILGVILNFFASDIYVKRQSKNNNGITKPEHRLPLTLLGGLMVPIGFFLYGWSVQFHIKWAAPIIGTALIGFGVMVTNIPCYVYSVDAFGVYGASAMAAVTVIKCVAGAVLPLAAPPLYYQLDYGWGNSVLALVALALMPIPLFFWKFGERVRESSRFQVVM